MSRVLFTSLKESNTNFASWHITDSSLFVKSRIVLFLSSKSPKQQSFLLILSKNFCLNYLNIQIENDIHPLFYQCMMNKFSLLLVY